MFWVASVAIFLVSLDTTMLYAAFGALRAGFPGASAADMSWVLNAYTVVYAAMLIPAGGLADTHGRKRVFLLGVTLFIAASALCGLAGNVGWLIAARVLQAVGAALLTPASLSIVLAAFPQSRRAVTVSLWGAVGGFAAAVGPSLGSFIVQTVGWPWAFFINLPIGAMSLWWGASLLRESDRGSTRRRVDGVGMALLVVAVGAIALAIVEADSTELDPRAAPGDGRHRRDRARGIRRLGAQRARAAGRPGAVPPPDLQRGQRGHADIRHRVRDDVLRLLLLHGQRVALQPGARRAGHRARSADGDPGRRAHRSPRRALRASAVPDRRRAAVRRGRALVHARSR